MSPVVDEVKLREFQEEAAYKECATEEDQSPELDIGRHSPAKVEGDVGTCKAKKWA